METANLVQVMKNILSIETNDPLVQAALGLAIVFAPYLAGTPICPYSRYVLEHGVETRVFVGTRHDN